VSDEAALADQLADRVNRLRQTRIDPEGFHVEMDSVARDLRKLANRLRGDTGRRRIHTWTPPAKPKPAI
jgi:hypothetical protein